MVDLYIDATIPLRWGPHPLVGIPRVESAIVRQALRQDRWPVRLFRVDRYGVGHLLSDDERRYVGNLVEGRVAAIDAPGPNSFWARASNIARSLNTSAGMTGREFDRVAASYLARTSGRSGLRYELAKTCIRLMKLGTRKKPSTRIETIDPLSDPGVTCFLSTAGLHNIAIRRQGDTVKAQISTICMISSRSTSPISSRAARPTMSAAALTGCASIAARSSPCRSTRPAGPSSISNRKGIPMPRPSLPIRLARS